MCPSTRNSRTLYNSLSDTTNAAITSSGTYQVYTVAVDTNNVFHISVSVEEPPAEMTNIDLTSVTHVGELTSSQYVISESSLQIKGTGGFQGREFGFWPTAPSIGEKMYLEFNIDSWVDSQYEKYPVQFTEYFQSKKMYIHFKPRQVNGSTHVYIEDTTLGFDSVQLGDGYTLDQTIVGGQAVAFTIDLGAAINRFYFTFEVVEGANTGFDFRVYIHTAFERTESSFVVSFLASQMSHQSKSNTVTEFPSDSGISVKFLTGMTTYSATWENFAYVTEPAPVPLALALETTDPSASGIYVRETAMFDGVVSDSVPGVLDTALQICR